MFGRVRENLVEVEGTVAAKIAAVRPKVTNCVRTVANRFRAIAVFGGITGDGKIIVLVDGVNNHCDAERVSCVHEFPEVIRRAVAL
jgi:nitrate reductase NapAB chaperone NapD